MKVQIDTTQNVVIEYDLAGVGERVGAAVIDMILLVLYAYAGIFITIALAQNMDEDAVTWLMFIIVGVPFLFYHPLSELLMNGQSIGKKLVKIRVVRLDGTQAGIGNYLLRWLISWVELTATFGSVALVTVMANGRGQRLGDIAAGTTVVKVAKAVNIRETIMARVDPDYQPLFPQVQKLNDGDIAVIKEVIGSRERIRNPIIMPTLVRKVESVLGVENTQAPLTFLRTVVKDYNYYTSGIVEGGFASQARVDRVSEG